MSERNLTLRLLNNSFAVCRLKPEESIPGWIDTKYFYSITRTKEELSVVCTQESVPSNIQCEGNWRILQVVGPLDFSLIGILSSISTVLARQCISIFAISTYDTDYILIKDQDIKKAVEALSEDGYRILSE